MTELCCTISVERIDEASLNKLLHTKLGSMQFLGVHIVVEDRSEAYSYTRKFMEEQGIEEPNPILRSLQLNEFNVDIDIFCSDKYFGAAILNHLADAIGCMVSIEMKTRVLVTFANQENPFCMFKSGDRVKVFIEENRELFTGQSWKPSFM